MTDTGKTRSKKGATQRERIHQVARQQLIEKGYDGLVLRSLAEHLGMTLGNLQYYFPSRESLVEAVVRREAESDISELKLLCEQGDGRQVDFERFVSHLVTKWRGDSGKIFGLLNYLSLHNDAFRAIYYEVYDQFYAALVDVIRCTNPALSEAESLLRARVVTALVDGAVLQLGQSGKRKFLREIARVARETVMAGS